MKPISSAITTGPSKTDTATGTQLGGRGLATQPNAERIAAWLATQAPSDMDKAAVSRASQHGVGLRVKYEGRYPSGPNGERLPSYVVAVACDVSPQGDHAAALADLRNFLTPAPMRQIEAWLATLSVTVAKRKDDSFTEELRLTTYASRLARYPADVARTVCNQSYSFWPTWAEIEARCDALTSPRLHMIKALERGPVQPEPARRPPTQEERDRIQELINTMFPDETPENRAAAVDEITRGDCMAGKPMAGFS